jgi:hypothetical protein
MLRWSCMLLISAGCLSAEVRWKCDPTDGKFIATPGINSKKFYCWDGQIFSEEKGYTPPPGYVLAYWEEVHRRSQQIRDDMDRRCKELREKVQQAPLEAARLNQERAEAHKEFMDKLNRGQTSSSRGTTPKTVVVSGPERAASTPPIPPASREKVSGVQVGMARSAVEEILGKPHGSISIPEEDGLLETLTYLLDDNTTARVRLKQGKVESVKISD